MDEKESLANFFSEEFLRGLWKKAEHRALEISDTDRVTKSAYQKLADAAYSLALMEFEDNIKIINRIPNNG
jgi:hypothetical protein